jgi:hypothetical protein
MFPDHYFPGKRRMGKTARSQFYRTGIVLCDDYPVVRAYKSHYSWMLWFFSNLEMNN